MADISVDPALFRLRAFEVEWLEPLLDELHNQSIEAGRMESDDTALLLYVLIIEANHWLTIGQQVGYFTQISPSTVPLSLAEPPELEWLLSSIRSRTEPPPDLDIRGFARALSEARDDLTTERREFLRLVFFAEEIEWSKRIQQLRTLAEKLAARPEEFLSPGTVDEASWGLNHFEWEISGEPIHSPVGLGGTVLETSTMTELQRHLPAKWRLGSFALLAEQSPTAGRRLAVLAETQTAIAAALAPIEHPTPSHAVGTVDRHEEPAALRSTLTNPTRTQQPIQPVQNPLTAIMTAKSPEDYAVLQQLIGHLQSLPPEENPITVALNNLGTVHFARFVFLGNNQLGVISTYDGDFDTHINDFVDELGDVFNVLLEHVGNAPPRPVQEYRQQFIDYIHAIDRRSVGEFYSAYPDRTVLNILALSYSSQSQRFR